MTTEQATDRSLARPPMSPAVLDKLWAFVAAYDATQAPDADVMESLRLAAVRDELRQIYEQPDYFEHGAQIAYRPLNDPSYALLGVVTRDAGDEGVMCLFWATEQPGVSPTLQHAPPRCLPRRDLYREVTVTVDDLRAALREYENSDI